MLEWQVVGKLYLIFAVLAVMLRALCKLTVSNEHQEVEIKSQLF